MSNLLKSWPAALLQGRRFWSFFIGCAAKVVESWTGQPNWRSYSQQRFKRYLLRNNIQVRLDLLSESFRGWRLLYTCALWLSLKSISVGLCLSNAAKNFVREVPGNHVVSHRRLFNSWKLIQIRSTNLKNLDKFVSRVGGWSWPLRPHSGCATVVPSGTVPLWNSSHCQANL